MNAAPLLCLLLALPVQAAPPAAIGHTYAQEAARQQPGFTASPQRGEQLFRQRTSHNAQLPSCTSCHTDAPGQPGQHALTGKPIRPLAVRANPDRFADPAKVEKWFGRNCRDVFGRLCTPAEKADLVAYLSTGG